jgi:hypothetical protein
VIARFRARASVFCFWGIAGDGSRGGANSSKGARVCFLCPPRSLAKGARVSLGAPVFLGGHKVSFLLCFSFVSRSVWGERARASVAIVFPAPRSRAAASSLGGAAVGENCADDPAAGTRPEEEDRFDLASPARRRGGHARAEALWCERRAP